jgi:D-alanyl-D-alanine carboxypeptidase
MRGLLAENLEKASTKRTVAAITERNPSEANADVAEVEAATQPPTIQVQGAVQAAPVEPAAPPPVRSTSPTLRNVVAAATAAVPPPAKSDARFDAKPEAKSETRSEPAPLTNGVIQTQPIAAIPGSSEPMKPVKVKTVQIKAGQVKLASAGGAQPSTPVTNTISSRQDMAETSSAVMAKAETSKPESSMPPQPANHGTGNGVLGVLPASSVPSASPTQAMAYADPAPRAQPQAIQQNGAIKPEATHTGWIIQVGALESESEARLRIEAARSQAHGLLNKADPFTEPVVAKGERKLFRARFAGLDRDQAEAVCRTLKHSDISCITVRN